MKRSLKKNLAIFSVLFFVLAIASMGFVAAYNNSQGNVFGSTTSSIIVNGATTTTSYIQVTGQLATVSITLVPSCPYLTNCPINNGMQFTVFATPNWNTCGSNCSPFSTTGTVTYNSAGNSMGSINVPVNSQNVEIGIDMVVSGSQSSVCNYLISSVITGPISITVGSKTGC